MIELEKAFLDNAIKKEKWLFVELLKGLEAVGVKVWFEEEPMQLNDFFKTILHIETEDGKRYAGGLRQKIKFVSKKVKKKVVK